MESVKSDLSVGEVLPQTADVSFGYIDTGVPDLIDLALMVGKIFRGSLRNR